LSGAVRGTAPPNFRTRHGSFLSGRLPVVVSANGSGFLVKDDKEVQ